MVITVLVTGIPRFVSLKVLSYNLDSILSPNEVGKFRLREYTKASSWHREIYVDFNDGFEAMCAQELLHNFELILENGSNHRLKAKVISASASRLSSMSPKRDKTSLMTYNSNVLNDADFDNQLQMLEKYQKMVQAETKLVVLKRKLKEEKEKYFKDKGSLKSRDSDSSLDATSKKKRKKKSKKRSKSKKDRKASNSSSQSDKAPDIGSSESTDSDSSMDAASKKKRKKKSKKRSKSKKDRKASNLPSQSDKAPDIGSSESTDSDSSLDASSKKKRKKKSKKRSRSKKDRKASNSSRRCDIVPVSSSDNEPSCSFVRQSKSPEEVFTMRSPGRIARSKSRRDSPTLSATKPSTSRTLPLSPSKPSPKERTPSRNREEKRPKSRRSRSRTSKLKSPRPSGTSRRRSRSRSKSLGFERNDHKRRRSRSKSFGFGRNKQNRRRSRSMSNSRYRRQKSPYYKESASIYEGYSNYTEESRYIELTSPPYRRKSEVKVITVNRSTQNRITEISTSEDEEDETLNEEPPLVTEEGKALIANKLEEASKSIVNEINIALACKHVSQLKVLDPAEREQALASIKQFVDEYLMKLIPDTTALTMTVIGIVNNFRMSFSRDEENNLVEGIINDILKTRDQGDNLEHKDDTKSESMKAGDWRAGDDQLRAIDNEENKENPFRNNGVQEKVIPTPTIPPYPLFFLPVKKLLKQMYNIIEPLDFHNDESLEYQFFKELKIQMRQRIKDLLNDNEFMPTVKIIQLYRETYPLDSDLMFIHNVYIHFVKGNEDVHKNTEVDRGINDEGSSDATANNDIPWRNVSIKPEANSGEPSTSDDQPIQSNTNDKNEDGK